MYGQKYAWVLPSTYPPDWWKNASAVNCSQAEISAALNGYFGVHITTLSSSLDQPTISGQVSITAVQVNRPLEIGSGDI